MFSLNRYPKARKCSIVLNKDADLASRMILYAVGTMPSSKVNMVSVAKSDGFKTSWEEYKVRKMANVCRSGRKSWRGDGEAASNDDDYDPMGDSYSAYEVQAMEV